MNNTVVKASNVLPDSMDGGAGAAIRNAWAANGVVVSPQTLNSPNDAFDVTYTFVPDESCVDLVSATIGSFNSASVNGNAVTNVADIAVNCNAGDNTIIWTL